MQEKFLPIGTVCKLKGANQKVAITGFCMINENHPDKVFDYVGCYYPQGVVDLDKNLLFNHENIEEVIFKGYVDNEEVVFKKKIKEILESRKPEQTEIFDESALDMSVPVATFVNEE